jgi:uncharacterized protein
MRPHHFYARPTSWLLAALLLTVAAADVRSQPPSRVSQFGRYEGWSEPRYTSWIRTSEYVTVRDGTRLAVDVIRPAVNGRPAEGRFPVVWSHTRYQRGQPPVDAGRGTGDLANLHVTADPSPEVLARRNAPSAVDGSAALQTLVRHGYVVVVVQVRGGGASFGRYRGFYSPEETRDAYDIMNWLVAQPWCDGTLGMFGGSYPGSTQYAAASTRHPALRAIFPEVAGFSLYDMLFEGGIWRDNLVKHWAIATRNLDLVYPEPPVDADSTGALRDEALALHRTNWDIVGQLAAARWRDHESADFAWRRHEPTALLDQINGSGVAIYSAGGWYDAWSKDPLLWLVNYRGPGRALVGFWSHAAFGPERNRITAAEQHRWFDRWLKGIPNGIDREPPLHYAVIDDSARWEWRSAPGWPVPGVTNVRWQFGPGRSGSIASPNDGTLSTSAGPPGRDAYVVDPTTTTGTATRWDHTVGQGAMRYPAFEAAEARGLTYTTAPLAADLEVIGYPVVTLNVTSDQPDADVHVTLSEVDSTGASRYVTEGQLRASHRATATPPWNNLGLPWHSSGRADVRPLVPGQPATLTFVLQPTATRFNRGHRLRIAVTGADADNTEPPPIAGRTTLTILRDAAHPSGILLPVMEGR